MSEGLTWLMLADKPITFSE